MAETTKKTTTTKKATKNTTVKDKEIKDLKAQNEQLTEQMSKMAAMMASLEDKINNSATSEPEIETNGFRQEDEITIISMIPHTLVVYSGMNCSGNRYIFRELGEEQDITWGDLKDIVRHNRKMVDNGIFYILNDQAVGKLRLKNAYRKMLSPDDIRTILDKDANTVAELYKMAPEGQKKTIIELVAQKKLDKKKIDANILDELSSLSGKNLLTIENPMDIPKEGTNPEGAEKN